MIEHTPARSITDAPRLSVIVPAYRCGAMLARALGAIHASDLAREGWELIVVDDGSGDSTGSVAASFADTVITLPAGPSGPAFARNRGAQAARGAVLAFVDADVVVHTNTLRRLLDALGHDDGIGAVFGSYDTAPPAPGLISRYRNLLHHYVHTNSAGDAETFWAGCGAVRRNVFAAVGGFDEKRYRRPKIEDIELGHRIRDLGFRILLRPDIQCTHLKQWSLSGIVRSDLFDRGIPWVELLLEEGRGARASTLNVQTSEKFFVFLAGLAMLAMVLAIVVADARWFFLGGICLLLIVAGNARLLGWFWTQHGAAITFTAIPMRILHYILSVVSVAIGVVRRLTRTKKDRALTQRASIALSGDTPQVG